MTSGAIAGLAIGVTIAGIILGLIIGYFVATKLFKRQVKKNPPISKDTIRMIYRQVGRQPSEKQVNEIYNKVTKA